MFQSSSQQLAFQQQIITVNECYPCPRCNAGIMEPFGLTETFQCNACSRAFVPLKGSRFLYPAKSLGWKIAPTFWWDGFRWHWASTTATTRQLAIIVAVSLVPVLLVNMLIGSGLWTNRPEWCNPVLISPLIGLISIQLAYLMCWDFNPPVRQKSTGDTRETADR